MLETADYIKSSSKARIRLGVAVYPRRGTEVLLQERSGTELYDGYWDAAAGGGLEVGSDPKQTAIDEAFQELGIKIRKRDLIFINTTWVTTERGENLLVFSFEVHWWEGTPTIMEPDKCSKLVWFDASALPDSMIPARKEALLSYYAHGILYTESDERIT